MFRRKPKRSEWLSFLLEIEQLYKDGYIHESTSESHIWFKENIPNMTKFKFGIPLGFRSNNNQWKVQLLEDYKEYLKQAPL